MRKTPSCQKNVATVLKHDGNYSYAYYSLTVTTAQNKPSYQPKCHPLQGSQLHGATRGYTGLHDALKLTQKTNLRLKINAI